MKNALILHGTDFDKDLKQRLNNWFPWLKKELEQFGYSVWLPELPEAWRPDLERYWNFLKGFKFNEETLVVGHSSGGATVFGILNKLPLDNKIKLAVSVAGFYKDEGWNCEGLFKKTYNWEKIRKQAEKIQIIWSETDPYISAEQTNYLANKLGIESTVISNMGHFSLETSKDFKRFPGLLEMIKKEIGVNNVNWN